MAAACEGEGDDAPASTRGGAGIGALIASSFEGLELPAPPQVEGKQRVKVRGAFP